MIPFAIFQDDHGNLFTVSNTVVTRAKSEKTKFWARQHLWSSHKHGNFILYKFIQVLDLVSLCNFRKTRVSINTKSPTLNKVST